MSCLQGEEPSTEKLRELIRIGCIGNSFVPIFCGSAFKNKGVQPLLDAVVSYLPSPLDVPPMKVTCHGIRCLATTSYSSQGNYTLQDKFSIRKQQCIGNRSGNLLVSGTWLPQMKYCLFILSKGSCPVEGILIPCVALPICLLGRPQGRVTLQRLVLSVLDNSYAWNKFLSCLWPCTKFASHTIPCKIVLHYSTSFPDMTESLAGCREPT